MNCPEIRILKAERSDVAEILALQKLAFQTEAELYGKDIQPLRETLAEAEAAFPCTVVLKAVSLENLLAGSVRGRLLDDGFSCRVGKLMVHPEFRRRGIAKALLLALEAALPEATRFELFTGERSVGNIKLYKSAGYQEFKKERPVRAGDAPLVFFEKMLLKR